MIASAALSVADHIYNNGAEAIIVSGGSNHVSRALFSTAWRNLFPDAKKSPLPKIFVFDEEGNKLLYQPIGKPVTEEWRIKAVQTWIDEHHPILNEYRQKKICYLDDFIDTGIKHERIKEIFQALKFTQIDFCYFFGREISEAKNAYVSIRNSDTVDEIRFIGSSIRKRDYVASLPEVVLEQLNKNRQEAKKLLRDYVGAIRRT